jgi:hypothetical protein
VGEYLTVTEAARVLGVAPPTLRNRDRTDKLKPKRHPLNRYRREDLGAFLEQIATSAGGLREGRRA